MNVSLGSLLAGAAFRHHEDTTGVYQPCSVDMMLECSPDRPFARAVFKDSDDKGNTTLKDYAIVKGFMCSSEAVTSKAGYQADARWLALPA